MLGRRKPFSSTAELGRLAILSQEKMREAALELQGIPELANGDGWPLTKGFWPFDYQRSFIFDLPSVLKSQGIDAFNFVFVGGLGSGKTKCGSEKSGDIAFRNRGCMGGIFSPTYRMLEDSTKTIFMETLVRKGISHRYRASDNSVMIFGDTKIIFRSLDAPEHLRGPELAWAWVDECGQMPNRKAIDIVLGRIRDPRANEPCVLHTTTPDGLNWFYDFCVEDAEKNKVRFYNAKTEQNLALDTSYVERLRDIYDSRYARQELSGEFLDVFVGRAYWNFERADSIDDSIDYDRFLPLILAFDLNVDPMCWNIGQTVRADGYQIDAFFDEIHIRSASTGAAAEEFLRKYGNHKAGVKIYGDATCRSRTTATTRTDYEVIKFALKSMPGLEIHIGRSNPAITDSIAAVNARLLDSQGRRKLLLHPRCKFTIKDYERVAFRPGTREIDKSTGREQTHHTDAIRYYIAREYPLRAPRVTIKQ